ncbi:MAG: alanine/ornithine racemase family PLP-dependent enzyme [Deltaproteobacteria bacterium]|nr:alanine/ornithine racemase family PLP-dependent enzyme [Deltaproteobacteria bacterium]MBW2447441.1 alanine/ornithine racemase family PLP-dependent enzyme [Deltaproteobacteria bacterium]
MSAPRLEIRLDRIHHNAKTLVDRLALLGVGVVGVTKAALGLPEIARTLISAGVTGIGDSRIENIETMRRAGLPCDFTLIRSPMISQAERVVAHADVSHNTEIDVVERLSACAQAQGRTHGVLLMVELGDLRDGILPAQLPEFVGQVLRLPNIAFRGIGTNLACQSGVAPDQENMDVLSSLADSLEATLGVDVETVSGGNSANLGWALSTADPGRVNALRLGEAILLGRDPLHRKAIEGLHTNAFTLVAEVIECKRKPTKPWGELGQTAFGPVKARTDRGVISQAILALGRQDIDPDGLEAPDGMEVLGASSDHLVLDAGPSSPAIGSEVMLQLNYSALLRAMTSPFVTRVISEGDGKAEDRGLASGVAT